MDERAGRLVKITEGIDVGGLRPLIAAGLLEAGSRLVIRRRGKVELEATVDDLGRIVHAGRPHRSPSDRAFSMALGRQSLNGWKNWEVQVEGEWVVLDDLRQRLTPHGESLSSVETHDLG